MHRPSTPPALFAALLTALASGCNPDGLPPESQEHLPRVETVQPTHHALLPLTVELAAIVEAMEKADLCARVPGVVETFQVSDRPPRVDLRKPEVDIGRHVSANEPLIKLAVPDLEADKQHKEALLSQSLRQVVVAGEAQKVAAGEVKEAEELLKRKEADLELCRARDTRTARLGANDTLAPELVGESRKEVSAAQSGYEAGKARVNTARARLQATGAALKLVRSQVEVARADVNRLQVLLDGAIVRAPFDGVVTRRWVDRGGMVKDTTTPVLTVMRTDCVRVLLDIPESDVRLVNATEHNPNPDGLGDPVEMTFPALRVQVPGGKFTGHIRRVGAALDPKTRTMRAEVDLENKQGYLWPGLFGTARVLLEERYDVITIPSSALARQAGRTMVFFVADAAGDPPRGRLQRRRVEVVLDDGHQAEVRGLTGQELIIVKGNGGRLREGDAVIAVPAEN